MLQRDIIPGGAIHIHGGEEDGDIRIIIIVTTRTMTLINTTIIRKVIKKQCLDK